MAHGAINDAVYQNMNLLENLVEKQGRIVRLEQQVYSLLETEFIVATKTAADSASYQADELDDDLDTVSESDPEEDNISATHWSYRDASPGTLCKLDHCAEGATIEHAGYCSWQHKNCSQANSAAESKHHGRQSSDAGITGQRKRRRSSRRGRIPTEAKLSVLEEEQMQWLSSTEEDCSSSDTMSLAKELSPMSPPSYSPSPSSAGNNQGDLTSWHTPPKGEPRQCDALLMKGPCKSWNPCAGCLAPPRWKAEEDSSSS